MNRILIENIKVKMATVLTSFQMNKLDQVLAETFTDDLSNINKDFIKLFIYAKKSEGKSIRTEKYYLQVLRNYEKKTNNLLYATSDDLRSYLYEYRKVRKCSAQTIDNIRRILSSFYSWLENENYIIKSPMKRINKLKIPNIIKPIFSDEEIFLMREKLIGDDRNLAMFDLLTSSGLRVGELVALNKTDINLDKQYALVYGKGAKERYIYFDTKTRISLKRYLLHRLDDNPALFITKRKNSNLFDYNRISINQVENIIKKCGMFNDIKSYPHKFRRTFATKAIDKGMPIEQVQVLLGHTEIDTTLRYAQVQQRNVQYSYQKYII